LNFTAWFLVSRRIRPEAESEVSDPLAHAGGIDLIT